MLLTTDAIRSRLASFAAEWSKYDGSERAEAQTFLNGLFECYGQDRKASGAKFEDAQEGRFLDLIYPGVCIIEMKRPSEAKTLAKHREQALNYWRNSADAKTGVEAPEYVVLCAFSKFEIWQPGRFPKEPRLAVELAELPDNLEALQFLAGRQPVFKGNQLDLTRDAVSKVASLSRLLVKRGAGDEQQIRHFVFQCVWCMFAEDVGLLDDNLFSRLIERLKADPTESSESVLGQLFEYMNRPQGGPEHGVYAGVRYVNGGLFAEPASIHLQPEELEILAEAALGKWADVEPAIFGGLLEGGMEHEQQWRLGAHYTHIADIQKIVEPTIARPWRERIDRLTNVKDAEQARTELLNYVVLDPACGSGNFLYVAYRELRRIGVELGEKIAKLRSDAGMPASMDDVYYPLSNVRGIEVDAFAIHLARVTLWMGHKLSVDELGLSEQAIPLADLSGIRRADALRVDWPRADAIIGNPPFHGSQMLRGLLGDAYIDFLKKEFGIGVKDFCVYWFRKAHDSLEPGKRAGLVGTNSISQNRGRAASLEYIVENGGVITDAVSTQKWPGEAKVHVSMVNWVKDPVNTPEEFRLDGVEVDGISISLTIGPDEPAAEVLSRNSARCFQGPIPVGDGFVLTVEEASELLKLVDGEYGEVVRPYMTSEDIARRPGSPASRFIVDFAYMSLEAAEGYPAALELVRDRVKPFRETVNREGHRKYWWRFGEPRRGLRDATSSLPRFIAGTRHGKRIYFVWVDPPTLPSDATNVFAFADDFAFGVLTSSIHIEWARHLSSTIKGDIRYTPSSAFMTFPWPDASESERERIGSIAAELVALRSSIAAERELGLTALYNSMDEGAYEDLANIHRKLDEAVAECYGWPKAIAHDAVETNRRLLELNQRIARSEIPYTPFAYQNPPE